MKPIKLLIYLLLLFSLSGFGQTKKLTKTGKIFFEASVPSFEEIKAISENVSCVFDTKTGELNSLALIRGFQFKIALMEEHFNDSFINSDQYPKATFKGVLENFNINTLDSNPKVYKLRGKIKIKGKIKEIVTTARLKKINDEIEIATNFSLNTDDFGIEIPSILEKKISKNVNIKADFLVR